MGLAQAGYFFHLIDPVKAGLATLKPASNILIFMEISALTVGRALCRGTIKTS
jgi:hypothetical protein